MVSYYGYELWGHKQQQEIMILSWKQVIKPFLRKNAYFFSFFQR